MPLPEVALCRSHPPLPLWLDLLHRLCWGGAVAGLIYVLAHWGTDPRTRHPLAIAGLVLVGAGLVRSAKRRLA